MLLYGKFSLNILAALSIVLNDWYSYSAKMYVNDDQLGNTTAFYITSPTRLCIEAFSPDDYRMSDKMYWCEMKKAVELWEEFR